MKHHPSHPWRHIKQSHPPPQPLIGSANSNPLSSHRSTTINPHAPPHIYFAQPKK